VERLFQGWRIPGRAHGGALYDSASSDEQAFSYPTGYPVEFFDKTGALRTLAA
jgi:hypothetical protein